MKLALSDSQTLLQDTVVRLFRERSTPAHVRIDVGGTVVTASITNESVEELGLKVGEKAYAVIKASDVMVAVP